MLFDFIDENPIFEFHPSAYTNDPFRIAANDRMVAINSAIEVDLTGQVCAESIGSQFYSGFGGQLDFIRGAARSKYGKPIIALPSTAKGDKVSRLCRSWPKGRSADRTRRRPLRCHRVRGRLSARQDHPQRAEALIQWPIPSFARARRSTANNNAGFNAMLMQWKCEGKTMSSQPRGNVIIDAEECKGCGLCVESCPPDAGTGAELNHYGVHAAQYTGEGCTGCGVCFYCCPEPGAITVYR